MDELVNLTPHEIVVFAADGTTEVLRLPSAGVVRVAVTAQPDGDVTGVPVVRITHGPLIGLPDPVAGRYYLVSQIALDAARGVGRRDVLAPDTSDGSVVRDHSGATLGVRRLSAGR